MWDRVTERLNKRCMGQNELARRVEVSSGQMSAMRVNNRIPRADVAIRMARELKVSVEWLVLGEGSPNATINIKYRVEKPESDGLEVL